MKMMLTLAMMIGLTALTGHAATEYLSDNFEAETVGTQPTIEADIVRPLTGNTATVFTMVTSGTTNTAGTGQGVQLLDDASDNCPLFSILSYPVSFMLTNL